MYFNLDAAKKYVRELDELRFNRALSDSSHGFQHVFQLISLLLHVNQPYLPGYLSGAPQGIAHFSLSDYQKEFLSAVAAEREFAKTVRQISHFSDYAIDGIYAMGSTSSVTQTSSSDLDIWLCHSADISAEACRYLEEKTLLLQKWALQFNVEINFFLMTQNRFRHSRNNRELCGEHCGSSLHMLLLEEFYRSAIRLAGKPLLWLHIYTESEQEYEAKVLQLEQAGEIDLNDWVDFGGLGALSADEYFGATLWILNKSIDAPYKSVLKILLLEVYSQEYPDTRLIAPDFKRRLLKGETAEGFDPYIAMLEKVSEYLTALQDWNRLDSLRRSFYLKASEDLQHLPAGQNWRIRFLKQMVQEWGWAEDKLKDLNNRPFWKIKRVRQSYEMLMSMLMLSYRNLVNFGRKYHVDASIMPQDIYILMRKLYVAFEELPNKVNKFNLQISQDLSEKHLTFVEVEENRLHKAGWYLINQAPVINEFSNLRYVEYHKNLSYLVAHAYFNGLFTANTQLHIRSTTVTLNALRQFFADLRLSLPFDVAPVQNEDLEHSYEIRNVMIAVNLTDDPTQKLSSDHKIDVQQSDLFSFGPQEESLVGSIELTFRTSWNEVHTHHFAGSNAILLALKMLSNKVLANTTPLNALNVFCYSQYHRHALRKAVKGLVSKIINVKIAGDVNNLPTHNLRVAGKTWHLFFEARGINLQEIKDAESKKTENPAALFAGSRQVNRRLAVKAQSYRNYPYEIDSFASEDFLQFFFEDNADGTFNVYILDELNHLEIYRHCDGSKDDKIREINRIYTLSGIDGKDNPYKLVSHKFNYPQFYQLIRADDSVQITAYQSQRHQTN